MNKTYSWEYVVLCKTAPYQILVPVVSIPSSTYDHLKPSQSNMCGGFFKCLLDGVPVQNSGSKWFLTGTRYDTRSRIKFSYSSLHTPTPRLAKYSE